MKKMIMMFLGFMLALCLAGTCASAPTPATGQAQTVCPVLGGKINKNVYTDYQGKRVYFCCSGCATPFKQNPEKYLKKLDEQSVTPAQISAGN